MQESLSISVAPAHQSDREALIRDFIVPSVAGIFDLHRENLSNSGPIYAYSTAECVEGTSLEPIEISWNNRSVRIDPQVSKSSELANASAHMLAIQVDDQTIVILAGVDVPQKETQQVDVFENWTIVGYISPEEDADQLTFTPSNTIDTADVNPSKLPASGLGILQVHLFDSIHKTRVEPLNFVSFDTF